MDIKCPKCGNNLGEYDVFCSKCGEKINRDELIKKLIEEEKSKKEQEKKESNTEQNKTNSQEILKKSLNNFLLQDKDKKKQSEFFDPSAKKELYSNPAITFGTFILVVVIIFATCVSIVIQRQHNISESLKYKNYINNPNLIPEFKESKTYDELEDNFSSVDDFLELYLRFSEDSIETKEQIFMAYLKEVQKISHITSENVDTAGIKECSALTSTLEAQKCSKFLNKKLKPIGVLTYANRSVVYLYPDYKYIYKRYANYFSDDLKKYLKLCSKYNIPTTNGIDITIKPKVLANKISDFESFMLLTQNLDIKEAIEETLYKDVRSFIFAPEIYATTTHELKKEFKNAYTYFIGTKKNSPLRPLIISYLDKQTSYDEENFKKDYPYAAYENDVKTTIENSTFQDIFTTLKNKAKTTRDILNFKYIYNAQDGTFRNYTAQKELSNSEFILSDIDSNNNIMIYSGNLNVFQELNLAKNSRLFLSNSKLYAYNKNKLSLVIFSFNGRTFSTFNLSPESASSVFPGVDVISIDSSDSYNIYIEKDNIQASYVILSKHSQGWENYKITTLEGQIQEQYLDTLFKVDSAQDIVISFHSKDVSATETSESAPTYRITIHTRGQNPTNTNTITNYDETTRQQASEEVLDNNDTSRQDLLPKIDVEHNDSTPSNTNAIAPPPSEALAPPND